uniref:ATPase AAA-type core domain-containing protein n=1 Tax=Tanacetum cinerariifolium TaxID=118510 RepID=A0A6L2L0S0_TANCI|nr:hypothetical protein [Tanacetum cinerariifolium]
MILLDSETEKCSLIDFDSRELRGDDDGKKFVEKRFTFNKLEKSQMGIHCLEYSIMDVDQVCEKVRKPSKLELIVSCKVDVDVMVDFEKDQKGMSKEVIGLVDFGCMTANKRVNSQFLVIEVDESQDYVTRGEMNLVSAFQDCVKGCDNDLEMVVDNIGVNGHKNGFEDQLWEYEKHKESLVGNRKEYDGKQDGNKEDGEFVHVSKEIELSDHCSVDIVKSFEVDQTNHQKSKGPCVVFIDEFDTVGRQRGACLGCGND